MIVLVPSALLVRSVNPSDIANLRRMVGGLGVMGGCLVELWGF